MARTSDEFARINTGSQKKLDLIDKQIRIINSRYSSKNLKGYCIGLPGAGLQAERHRNEYKKYGIPERRQIMVDYDLTVHRSQKRYMNKLDYKGKIVYGDLFNVVEDTWRKNKKIDIIDFDGVSFLTPDHDKLIKNAAKNDVKVIIVVLTNRCNKLTDHLIGWKKKLGLRKRYVKKTNKWQEPVKDIQEGAIRTLAKRYKYDVFCESYKGHGSPMLGFVLLRK